MAAFIGKKKNTQVFHVPEPATPTEPPAVHSVLKKPTSKIPELHERKEEVKSNVHSVLKKPKPPGGGSADMVHEPSSLQGAKYGKAQVQGLYRNPQSMLTGLHKQPQPMLSGPTPRDGKNWILDLIGRKFDEACISIQKQKYPYRVVQIDEIPLEDPARPLHNEILITVMTAENFTPTGFSEQEKKADRLRVSVWFSTNMDKVVIRNVRLSPY